MEVKDIIAIGLGVWGAGLSTLLAIREYLKDRRSVIVYLEYVAFEERARVTVVNNGRRPVTITSIFVSTMLGEGKGAMWDDVPQNAVFDWAHETKGPLLPRTLEDGDHFTAPLNHVVGEEMLKGEGRVRMTVYDADGNEYRKFRRRDFNAKMGYYMRPMRRGKK